MRAGLTDCDLWDKIVVDFRESSFFWVIAVSLIYLLSNIVRALRWQLLLKTLTPRIRFPNVLFSIMISYLCNLVIARSGEFVQVGIVSKTEDQKYEEVIGTLLFERITDFFSLLFFIFLGITLSYNSLKSYLNKYIDSELIFSKIYVLLGLGLFGLASVIFAMRIKIKGRTIKDRFSRLIMGFRKGLFAFKELQYKGRFILYTAVIWSCYYLMMYGSFLMFDYSRSLRSVDALMVSVCGSLGTILPTPGGVGGYHAMVMEGMTILGIPSDEAISFAMITYLILNVICVVGFGVVSVIGLFLYNRKRTQEVRV